MLLTLRMRRRVAMTTMLSNALSLLAGNLACAQAAAPLAEGPMTYPASASIEARAVNQSWIELVLPESEPAESVDDPGAYQVTSPDDPSFAAPVSPVSVDRRTYPESAPYTASGTDLFHMEVVYRVYLKLPAPLREGRTYTVSAPGTIAAPLSFTWGRATPNRAIHVNQVAYLANGPKVAYLSAWTGGGSIDFSTATTFQLIDEVTGAAAFTGESRRVASAAAEPLSRSDVYALDFSSFTGEGDFHLYVPTVGSSYSFRISSGAFRQIGYTIFRGLTLQRDGDHGLTPAVTRWSRPAAHLDDALLESTGQRVNLTGGHMDAGDRGKYPYHSADASVALLSALQLFPTEIEAFGEALQIRESSNSVPDVLDEIVYELDFLEKVVMNTPEDGTVPFYLRPQNANGSGGYELLGPIEGKPNRKLYDLTMGPNRAETLYAAGALAMAYNTPLLARYLPARCLAYLTAAKRAFAGFEAHHSSASYFRDQGWYDAWTAGPHPWSDEMLVAAVNLFQATGAKKYLSYIQSELPANLDGVRRWGWTTGGPWLPAYVSLYQVTRPELEAAIPGIHDRAQSAIVSWAEAALGPSGSPYSATFGAPIPSSVYTNVGWYFTGQQTAYPLMLGYGVTQNPRYRDALLKTWSYLLGANPLSRSFVSGLGNPRSRPRWMVHELGIGEFRNLAAGDPTGWSEVPPGFPAADVQSGQYDSVTMHETWNLSRKDRVWPALSAYPVLYRYHDSWNPSDEVTIDVMARQAASIAPLLGTTGAASSCAVIQRGTTGAVADARIAEDQPTRNFGAESSAPVGGAAGRAQRALMQFDLASLPVDAEVDAATLTLSAASTSSAELAARLVTAPWDERTVSYSGIGGALSAALAGSASLPASFSGATSIDVTQLARVWRAGGNNGLVIDGPASALATIAMSEAASESARPALTVCYSTATFKDTFSLPDGRVIDGVGSAWSGRYSGRAPSAVAAGGHARLVGWGTLTTARRFPVVGGQSLHFSVRLFAGKPSGVTLRCKSRAYVGVALSYDGKSSLQIASNNLGWRQQRHEHFLEVTPGADGALLVDAYVTGDLSEVQVVDGSGAQSTTPDSNDRFDLTCQAGGFQMMLGYLGEYDDVLIEQVRAVH